MQWCEAVAQLKALEKLGLSVPNLLPGELLRLSVLTSLRMLTLYTDVIFDDSTAVALLPQLVKLESLSACCQHLTSLAVLGAVSGLTKLTSLRLHEWRSGIRLQDGDLQHLLPLRSLRSLVVACQPAYQGEGALVQPTYSDAALAAVKAALTALTHLQL